VLRLSVTRIALVACSALALFGSCTRRDVQYPRSLDEIGALWSQIRAWRAEAGLALDPSCAELIGFAPDGSSTVRDCSHRVVARAETCSLSDAICDNAEQICILAGSLRDNLWAQDKCGSANASCREVQAHCTSAIGSL